MNGVHLVCGYITEGYDVDDGTNLAENLLEGQTVKEAWFDAIDQTHGSGIILRVISEQSGCENDFIWLKGYVMLDPPVNSVVDGSWIHYCHD